jgi:hypothetical protein
MHCDANPCCCAGLLAVSLVVPSPWPRRLRAIANLLLESLSLLVFFLFHRTHSSSWCTCICICIDRPDAGICVLGFLPCILLDEIQHAYCYANRYDEPLYMQGTWACRPRTHDDRRYAVATDAMISKNAAHAEVHAHTCKGSDTRAQPIPETTGSN